MRRLAYVVVGFFSTLALGLWAQDGPGPDPGPGSGSPAGSSFSTQYNAGGSLFGGTGPGTAGFVLTSNGAALAPTFQVTTPASAALTRVDDTNVTLALGGTPSTALLQATSITAGWTGDLAFNRLTQGSARSVLGVTGNATADFASIQGVANQTLVVNGAGTALAFGSLDLAQSGTVGTSILPVANGGSGAATLTGLLQGNGTGAFTGITDSSTVGQTLRVTGATAYGWGALDLADGDAITGDLPDANLSANVPLLNANNTFTAGTQTSSGAAGLLHLNSTSSTANNRLYRIAASASDQFLICLLDDGITTQACFFTVERTANVADSIASAATAQVHTGTMRWPSYGVGAITSDASGNLTAVSDERAKRNIRPYTKGLAELNTLTPIQYGYSEASGLDQTKNDYTGFSAQDVEKSFPEAVGRMCKVESEAKDRDGVVVKPGTRTCDDASMRTLDDRAIIAALVNSVRELNARVIQLEQGN